MPRNNPAKIDVTLRTKIALIIFGLFLFLILLEAGLRLGGFIILSLQEYRNLQSIKQKGTYTIICVGESTTQEQYPSYLEGNLNRSIIGPRFSVINKGLRGTDTSVIVNNMEEYLAVYKPNMVVAMMGVNDGTEYAPLKAENLSMVIRCVRSLRTYKLARLLWLHIMTKFEKVRSVIYRAITFTQSECQSKNLSSAEADHKVRIDPKSKGSCFYFELGWLYIKQNKLSIAEGVFRKGIEINPNDSRCYMGLGRLYKMQNRPDLAEESLKNGIAVEPNNYSCYSELGHFYAELDKLSLAEELFRKGIAVNSKDSSLYGELVWVYLRQGKFSLAEEIAKKATEINPKDARLYGLCASVYEEKHQWDLASEYYSKANGLRIKECNSVTVNNYRKLKEILYKRGVRLVCVQYPMRSVDSLIKIFGVDSYDIVFVDNERIFKEAVQKEGYATYFRDMFAGDFGHCTDKGYRLLAENITKAISKEMLHK